MSTKTPIDYIFTVIFCLLGLVLLPFTVIWLIVNYNSFKSLKLKVEEADSGIDVALTKRFDVLTKAMNVAKGYAKHEKETLTEVIALRSGMSMTERAEVNKQMDNVAHQFNILSEQYPQLKADSMFEGLQKSIIDIEEHLQASRRVYNSNVTIFNRKQAHMPTSILADLMKLEKCEFFTAEEAKRKDVEMVF